MYQFALAVALIAFDKAMQLERDVTEISKRTMALPIQYDPERMSGIETVAIYFSEDRGKTWKLHMSCKPSENEALFEAACDGLIYFALQVKFKDGHAEPEEVRDLQVAQKVYVKSARRTALKAQLSDDEKEIASLKEQIKRFQKRIEELEAKRNSDNLVPRP
jgi:hypothetical protein